MRQRDARGRVYRERTTSVSRGSQISAAPRLIASAHSLSSASRCVPTMQSAGNSRCKRCTSPGPKFRGPAPALLRDDARRPARSGYKSPARMTWWKYWAKPDARFLPCWGRSDRGQPVGSSTDSPFDVSRICGGLGCDSKLLTQTFIIPSAKSVLAQWFLGRGLERFSLKLSVLF